MRAILDSWKKGGTIVVRKVMYGVNNYEACANEMTAIKATGLHHLSNVYNGTVYGDIVNWNSNEILIYGILYIVFALSHMKLTTKLVK